ncbi:8000_t:CDS:1, partial [Entrophospora sp. SA101]
GQLVLAVFSIILTSVTKEQVSLLQQSQPKREIVVNALLTVLGAGQSPITALMEMVSPKMPPHKSPGSSI